MRRHRARPEEQITAADPAFCQLLADIILARDVERRIQAGLVDHEHMPTVQQLERRAWYHLAAYVEATAFASDLTEQLQEDCEMERVKVNLSAIRDRKWAARMKKLGCTPEQIDLDPGTLLCSPPATLNSFH